jgi:hypothetical protein
MIYGIGINNADYVVQPTIDGKRVSCPFYKTWQGMLQRSYCSKTKLKHPTYIGVTCSEDWHLFSNFKTWMEKQPWQDCQLDKDILVKGNKIYSSETCVFVPSFINNLFLDSRGIRGEYPLGVSFHKGRGKLVSQVKVDNIKKHLGYFDNKQKAHEVWQMQKYCVMLNAVSKWEKSGHKSFNRRVAEIILDRADKILHDYQFMRITQDF